MSKSSRRFQIPDYSSGISINPDVLKHIWDNIDGKGPVSQAVRDAVLNDALATSTWNRNEVSADNAMARERELRQTAIQDTVQDAQAAGVNAYFALSGGATGVSSGPQASSPSGSTSSGSPRVTLDSILGIIQTAQMFRKTNADIKNVNAATKVEEEQARNVAADTAKKEAEAEGQRLSNKWIDRLSAAEEASRNAAANLDRERVKEVYANIRRADSEITRNLEQAKSETERRDLMGAQAVLARANAWNITALTPYMKAELEARIEQERALAQQATVAAAYQQGLIDNGMIEAVVRHENANASDAEVRAEVGKVEQRLKQYQDKVNHGNISSIAGESDTVVGGLFSTLKIAVDTVKP